MSCSDPKSVAGRGPRGSNPFDTDRGYSGQEYHRDREQELIDAKGRDAHRIVLERAGDDHEAAAQPGAVQRAWIHLAAGTVHGAGSRSGGGNPGEDFDSDTQGGGGAQIAVERQKSKGR